MHFIYSFKSDRDWLLNKAGLPADKSFRKVWVCMGGVSHLHQAIFHAFCSSGKIYFTADFEDMALPQIKSCLNISGVTVLYVV